MKNGKLSETLKKLGHKEPKAQHRKTPLWRGPSVDGITFSLLSRFLVCRERFRLLVVEGLRPTEVWSHRTGYGDMWHICEESHAANEDWRVALFKYTGDQIKRFRLQAEQIEHWHNICQVQFPLYVDYWSKHPDVKNRSPLYQEQVFDVKYDLPSGRTVRLRGKWDSVDQVGIGKTAGIWLQENKTKSEIDEPALRRQLTFDLQTMLYLVALGHSQANEELELPELPILGVRYNVVRRPLSGGKGTIKPHKAKMTKNKVTPAETMEHFYDRVKEYIVNEPHEYFARWLVSVTVPEINKFERQCLIPVLEQLCDWWFSLLDNHKLDPWGNPRGIHYRYPYGVYNPMNEDRASDLDEYMATGSKVGLHHVNELFRELVQA